MKIQEIEFSRLIPADYNPRVALTPDMPEFERLKNSIETFGNVEPIVWNERTGHIVGGHQRLAVLQHLGYTSAEVSVVDLDEKEEKLLNVALNKIKGQWDYSRLEEIFQEYELEEAKVTGFTGQEIALILAKNDDVEDPAAWQDDEEDEEDELNVPEGTNVVFMDDDIKQVVMEDLGLVPLDTLEKFERMCKLGFSTAQKNRTICFGLYPVANAYFMRGGYKKAAICVGTLIGMVATPGITFCEELQTKEDYELCCRIIRKYGACIRLDRFACDALHYSKGGCEDAWKDKSGVIRVAELLVAKYPDILKLNPKRPGEVLMVKRGKR